MVPTTSAAVALPLCCGALRPALPRVIPATPAFLRLSDGRVLGTPTPATRENPLRLLPQAPEKPAVLDPPPNVVTVVGQAIEPPTGAGDAKRQHQHGKKSHHERHTHGND